MHLLKIVAAQSLAWLCMGFILTGCSTDGKSRSLVSSSPSNLSDVSTRPVKSGTVRPSRSSLDTNARTALLLKVNVDSRYTALPGSRNIPKDTAYDADVMLHKRYLLVSTTDHITILDFAKRRRIVIDRKTGTFVEYSLYDTVGFRALELMNRNALNQALINAKIDRPAQLGAGREDNEHGLSVHTPPPVEILTDREGDEAVSSAAGKPLFRQSRQGMPVSVEDSTAFAQFLRYSFGGHPLILADVAKGRLIPNRVTFIFRNLAVNTVTITVTGAQRVEDAPYDLQPYAPRMLMQSQDVLEEILDRAWMMNVPQMNEVKQ